METKQHHFTPDDLADAFAALSANAVAFEAQPLDANTSANEETAKAWNTTPGMVALARAVVVLGRPQAVAFAALGLAEENEALLALGRQYEGRCNVR